MSSSLGNFLNSQFEPKSTISSTVMEVTTSICPTIQTVNTDIGSFSIKNESSLSLEQMYTPLPFTRVMVQPTYGKSIVVYFTLQNPNQEQERAMQNMAKQLRKQGGTINYGFSSSSVTGLTTANGTPYLGSKFTGFLFKKTAQGSSFQGLPPKLSFFSKFGIFPETKDISDMDHITLGNNSKDSDVTLGVPYFVPTPDFSVFNHDVLRPSSCPPGVYMTETSTVVTPSIGSLFPN